MSNTELPEAIRVVQLEFDDYMAEILESMADRSRESHRMKTFKQETTEMSSPTAAITLENLLYEKKGAIAYVTLNRPKVLNALNRRTWEDLKTAFEDARDDDAIRGVILTGAGDKAFIAGADISELAQVTA